MAQYPQPPPSYGAYDQPPQQPGFGFYPPQQPGYPPQQPGYPPQQPGYNPYQPPPQIQQPQPGGYYPGQPPTQTIIKREKMVRKSGCCQNPCCTTMTDDMEVCCKVSLFYCLLCTCCCWSPCGLHACCPCCNPLDPVYRLIFGLPMI